MFKVKKANSKWKNQLVKNQFGNYLKSEQNLSLIMHNDPEFCKSFKFNLMTRNIEVVDVSWKRDQTIYPILHDNDLHKIKVHISTNYRLEYPTSAIHEHVVDLACSNPYNPLLEYIEALKWDGKSRLDTWLHDFWGVEITPYTRAVARTWLLGAVARLQKPGIKFDNMLILQGAAGYLKTLGMHSLCPLPNYVATVNVDPDKKDDLQKIQGFWLIEMGELAGLKRDKERESLYAFLTSTHDTFRAPYARTVEVLPRLAVFFGTTNRTDFLRNDEAERRFWVVTVTKPADLKLIESTRNQLWAEAVYVLRTQQVQLWLPESDLTQNARKDYREAADPWLDTIKHFVEYRDNVTITDVYEHLKIETKDRHIGYSRRISNILRQIGRESKSVRDKETQKTLKIFQKRKEN